MEESKKSTTAWFACCTKCLPFSSSKSSSLSFPSPEKSISYDEEKQGCSDATSRRKPGGWRAMPYVLGNETFERLASIGLLANFMQFLLTQFHMDQVSASNVLNIWSGFTNFIPLLGAYLSDAYIGRFWTIAFASVFETMGMLTLTMIPWLPKLHPPPCKVGQKCQGPNKSQKGFLALGLGFLSIGSGGIRPCSIPFGVDQFDSTTNEGRKGIASFFNWYYTSFTVVLIIALTLVVYIQDSVSWVIGFGIPTVLMFLSLILFFIGTRVYVHVKPEGSIFSSIVQVFVVTYKKRKLKLSDEHGSNDVVLYDPPPQIGTIVKKLPLTNKYRSLNKAAIVMEGEVNTDGTRSNKWRLCSIQQIEEVKCLLQIIPVWASGIICFTAMAQQGTFTMSQALKMDRHLGPNFQIPAGSLSVISMITVGVWLPIYDRLIVPSIRKRTGNEGGITLLQRVGIGMIFSILSMVAAGLIEKVRRDSAIMHNSPDGIAPITVMWLAPQLILMGFAEAFNILGQIEFFNKEFPEHMSSLANSLFSVTVAGASYLSSLLVNILHKTTGGHGHPDWLTKDINEGRIENFYYLIAGLGVLNLFYFIYVSRQYQYKTRLVVDDGIKPFNSDVELHDMKY